MSDHFEDDRGLIQDLFGPIDSVTVITTRTGAVRGNHVHRETWQCTFVTVGALRIASGDRVFVLGPNEFCEHPPGEPHAWEALLDSECLVFTRGPRSGENYESDTYRLKEPLL